MRQVLQQVRSRRLEVVELPDPRVRPGSVAVRNQASLISAGTERTAVDFAQQSLLSKARSRPDLVRQVLDRVRRDGLLPTLDSVRTKLDEPLALGYSCAGWVTEVGRGAEEFAVGDRVACAGAGYASHAEQVVVPRNLVVRVPEGVSFQDAAYVTLGAIALHGVRTAEVRLGETVAVIGLGLLGQLTVQILRASGCRVLGIDLDPAKVAMARELGAEAAVLRSDDPVSAAAALTGGAGVDAVVITAATASNDPIELAGEICRDRGRVSIVGLVRAEIPRTSFYGKELEIRMSRSYGPGRYDPSYEEQGHDYPIGYVRWTERRNMEEFLRLVATGQVTPDRLSTHAFPVDRAAEAYALITGDRDEPFLGILVTYPDTPAPPKTTVQLAPPAAAAPRDRLRLGCIGAGSFGKTVLLPRLVRQPAVELVGLATSGGLSARTVGERFGFGRCTSDAHSLIHAPDVDAVVITTRHGSHARYTVEALRAGKAVFVEKPLALTEAELEQIIDAQAGSGAVLTVGFNRRFAPLSKVLREQFSGRGPLAVTYRINAGALPADHWVHDPEEGGGRIVGEVCHFVDLVQFLTGESALEVFALALGGKQGTRNETVSVTLRLSGGSLASINYFATGDKGLPKERIEVFGGGASGVLDDFRELTLYRGGSCLTEGGRVQDKGFDHEIDAFVAAARGIAPLPIGLDSLVRTTRATFAIQESLRTGQPVRVRGIEE